MSPGLTTTVEWVIIGVSYLLFVALFGLFLVYAERKSVRGISTAARAYARGLPGADATLADFIKLLMKELITPRGADKFLYNLAPYIVMVSPFLASSRYSFCPRPAGARL